MELLASKEDRSKSGVYAVINKSTQKAYIGSTGNFYQRFRIHKSKMTNGIGSRKLNEDVTKYGISDFEFRILEFVDKEFLIDRERILSNEYPFPVYNYNCV